MLSHLRSFKILIWVDIIQHVSLVEYSGTGLAKSYFFFNLKPGWNPHVCPIASDSQFWLVRWCQKHMFLLGWFRTTKSQALWPSSLRTLATLTGACLAQPWRSICKQQPCSQFRTLEAEASKALAFDGENDGTIPRIYTHLAEQIWGNGSGINVN